MKAAILDQRTVAGVGNIYADEALWRARIHPLTPAEKLEPDEVKALYKGDPRRRCAPAFGGRARRSATTASPTAAREEPRTSSRSTAAAASRATAAARRSTRSASPAAGRGTARAARCAAARRRAALDWSEMAGRTYKTEAIVLRSIRFSEADRILHLYTEDRGRIGAIAKGVRKTKSRFGARLEPLSHVELMLHQGRASCRRSPASSSSARTTRCARTPTG